MKHKFYLTTSENKEIVFYSHFWDLGEALDFLIKRDKIDVVNVKLIEKG